jgi:hypothetical protein
MKRTFCLVTLALFGCSTLVLAAGDPCTDKYNECVSHAMNVQAQCKARGSDPGGCNDTFEKTKKNCETEKNNCLGKSNSKQTTPPKKSDPKKSAAKTSSTPTTTAPKK